MFRGYSNLANMNDTYLSLQQSYICGGEQAGRKDRIKIRDIPRLPRWGKKKNLRVSRRLPILQLNFQTKKKQRHLLNSTAKADFILNIEANSNFIFIKRHPVRRGKINTDVTELHITLDWHGLWPPTQTLLLPCFGHSPTLSGLLILEFFASFKLTPGPTTQISSQPSLLNAYSLGRAWAVFSPLFSHGSHKQMNWQIVYMCACNARHQQHTGMRTPATLLALLDLGKNVCAQFWAMMMQ